MPLARGVRFGPYELTDQIGAGGMGAVWRAIDSGLNRQVAIKVLPDALADDPERLARFEREAKVLASLNHSNIATVYGLETRDGLRALVMELVAGRPLADRIAKGPLPLDEALAIARQVADALEAAHEQGIAHRDLKPANVMLRPDGTAKVLDFGLAKALESDEPSSEASQSPTITSPAMTRIGMILGTASYMAPEQAKGRPVDRRADIWALGSVLFEMLTGTRAFDGDDATDTIAAVLSREPEWRRLPTTASAVRPLLARCLKKNLRQRLQAMGDARIQIEELMSGPSDAPVSSPPVTFVARHVKPTLAAAVVSGALIAALVTGIVLREGPQLAPRPVQFEIVQPAALALSIRSSDRDIAISPDGGRVVYRAGGQAQLALRALDRHGVAAIAGITSARFPFFSPDGQSIGFFDVGALKKVSVEGGSPVTLCPSRALPRGASWGNDGNIVFATLVSGGLLMVSARGGTPTVLTAVDATKGERDHWFPSVLPGGRGVLFTIIPLEQRDRHEVAVLDLKSGERKTLIRGGSQAEYVESGHLVYAADAALWAVRFDLDRLEVLSDPVAVVDDVWMGGNGAANYAVSRSGTLVYVPAGASPRSLVWADRQGRQTPLAAPSYAYAGPRLSPDGSRIAVAIRDREEDIHVYDLKQAVLRRLASSPGVDGDPIWTPDGKRIVFSSQRGGGANLYAQPLMGPAASNV